MGAPRNIGILFLLIPGIPGAMLSKWLLDKLRKEPLATGDLEEFVFFTMIWAVAFWVPCTILLVLKLLS